MQPDVDMVNAVYDAGRAVFDVFESHVWTVQDERIGRFEVYLDTAGMLAALSAPATDLVSPAGRSTPPADVPLPQARRPQPGS
jgi:hypothetical protein